MRPRCATEQDVKMVEETVAALRSVCDILLPKGDPADVLIPKAEQMHFLPSSILRDVLLMKEVDANIAVMSKFGAIGDGPSSRAIRLSEWKSFCHLEDI